MVKSALHIKSITQFMNPVMCKILPLTGRNSGPHGKNRAALAVGRPGAAEPGAGSVGAQVCSHLSPKQSSWRTRWKRCSPGAGFQPPAPASCVSQGLNSHIDPVNPSVC